MLLMCVNLWAVLGSAVATMLIGFLWYSPMLFAKPWMVAMGYDPADKARIAEMQKSAGPKYGISFLASILSAFILGKIIYHLAISTALYGMKVGFAVWLAFVMTVQLTDKLFTNRPTKLLLINTGYQLACYLAMGAILGRWVGC
jgi:mannose/fructose/N-acetylgalactosamine-specific phosphotransferase system component IID